MCIHTIEDLRQELPESDPDFVEQVVRTQFPNVPEGRMGEVGVLWLALHNHDFWKRNTEHIAHYWDGLLLRTVARIHEGLVDTSGTREEVNRRVLDGLSEPDRILLGVCHLRMGEGHTLEMLREMIGTALEVSENLFLSETDGTVN